MPRAIRYEYDGAVYHVMCRGNNGQSIFEPARSDGFSSAPVAVVKKGSGQRLFLSTLEEVCQQTGWRIHAYVLMGNHYHLLLETPEANLVAGMKWFQGTYTQRFNAMFRCRGHLFQGRYKALPIEGDASYFSAVGNYIHLNPFRARIAGIGLEQALESYSWSSYPAYIGRRRKIPEWLERARLISACGFDPALPKSQSAYRSFVVSRMHGEIDGGEVDELVAQQLSRGWFVGGEGFRNWLAQQLPGRTDNLRGEQRTAHDEVEAERLLERALAELKVSESELLSMKNNRPEKQAVAWLLKKTTTVTGVWIAGRLRMGSRANISRALFAVSNEIDEVRKELKQIMTQCAG
jgi:putative transposase